MASTEDSGPHKLQPMLLSYSRAFVKVVKGVQKQLEGMQTQVEGMQTQVEGMQTQVEGMQTQVEGLKQEVGKLQETFDQWDRWQGLRRYSIWVRLMQGKANRQVYTKKTLTEFLDELIEEQINHFPNHWSYHFHKKLASKLPSLHEKMTPTRWDWLFDFKQSRRTEAPPVANNRVINAQTVHAKYQEDMAALQDAKGLTDEEKLNIHIAMDVVLSFHSAVALPPKATPRATPGPTAETTPASGGSGTRSSKRKRNC